jgi:hypothetical protein
MSHPPKVRLLETIVNVNDKPMPVEGDSVVCRYVAMSRNSRRHLYPLYGDDAIRTPKEGVILDEGRSCSWIVGTGEAIRGLDAAVLKMNEGEHMVWEVPPELGYGADGVPGLVGPDETLVFDLKLVSISRSTATETGSTD